MFQNHNLNLDLNEIYKSDMDSTANPYALYKQADPDLLSKVLNERLGSLDLDVLVANGADGILLHLFIHFSKKKKHLLVPQDSYRGFYDILSYLGLEYKLYQSSDIKKILGTMNSQDSVLLICRPNNPTGEVLDIDESLFKAFKGAIVVDESYVEFCYDLRLDSLVRNCEELYLIRSLSKAYGAPALRIGYAIGLKKNIENLKKERLKYPISSLAISEAIEILKDSELYIQNAHLIAQECIWLAEKLQTLGFTCIAGFTNFILARLGTPQKTFEFHQYLSAVGCKTLLVSLTEVGSAIRLTCRDRNTSEIFLELATDYFRELETYE